jgi:hypothetical protein
LNPVLPGTVDGVELLEDAHAESSPPDGEVPADAFAVRQDAAEGMPEASFPPVLFAAESSEMVDGVPPPHALPRLTLVGVPGDTSAFVQVEAFVGSCADARSPADAPAAPVARDTIVACRPESDVQTLVWLVSASAVGPLVSGSGVSPLGADGSVAVVAATGALALVPGPVAVVDESDAPFGCGVVPLETVTGSLDETAAGPTSPPLAVAVPPAAGWSALGRTSGWSVSRGSSANAALPPRWSSANTATI